MLEKYTLEFARAEQAGDPYAFRFAPQTYLLRTDGGGFQTSEFPWDHALLLDLSAVRRPGCDPAVVQRIGETLRRFLLPLGLEPREELVHSASRAGREVLISFRSAAAELYSLPWELLTLKRTGEHLGGLPGVLFRYEWPETQTTPATPLPRREGGRILLACSAAGGAIPAREHEQAIESACRAGFLPFSSEHDVLRATSCGRLVSALTAARAQGETIAVLHLLCHGGAAGSTFGLVLDGEDAGAEAVVVDGGRLRQLLGPFSDMVRLVVLSACDSGNSGALGNQLGSVAQTLHRAGYAQVIASRYPLAVSASIRLTETFYLELLSHTRSVEYALGAARQRLTQDAGQLDWAHLQLYGRGADGEDSRPVVFRPFRGLLSFQPRHGRFFFGRDREIQEVVTALGALAPAGRPSFLVVAGASGSGKSSLVLAGAAPRLAAEGALAVAVMQPGSEPLRALDEALRSVRPPGATSAVLLVVDQLEEIFTQVKGPAVRQDFVRRLWRLASDPAAGVRIIATLRVDFLGECGSIVLDEAGRRLDSVAYDQAHRIFVAQLGMEQLRAAIESPAQRVGIVLESGLTSRMLEAVGSEPGALPLLSYTLDLLWLRREGLTLTQAGYDAVGQIAGALSQHADTLLERMGEGEQRVARRLLVRLVHLGDGLMHGTRQRVRLQQLRPPAAEAATRFDHVLSVLLDARLLFRAGEKGDQTVEVAHEALIRRWPRLAAWLQQDREMLAELEKLEAVLVQWRVHKALLTGEQLSFTQGVAQRYPEDFPPEAATLLRASQKEELRIRWFKRSLAGLFVFGTVLFAGLFFDARSQNRKVDRANDALGQMLGKTSQRPSPAEMLHTLARLRLELQRQPELALAMIAQARELEPQNPSFLVDEAEYLLAARRFDQVGALVTKAFAATTEPELSVRLAMLAWSSAQLGEDTLAQPVWADHLKAEYARLPLGFHLPGLTGTSDILFRDQAVLQISKRQVQTLSVYEFLQREKTTASLHQLEILLGKASSK